MPWPFQERHRCPDAASACAASAPALQQEAWLTPREAFAEARGLVSLIKDSAADVADRHAQAAQPTSACWKDQGGSVAVLSGPDGKVLIDAGIAVSRRN